MTLSLGRCEHRSRPAHPHGHIPWNTQGDVHLASACEVEGIQGHLCGGLPDALGSQQAYSLAWVAQGALPLQLQQCPQPAEGKGDVGQDHTVQIGDTKKPGNADPCFCLALLFPGMWL